MARIYINLDNNQAQRDRSFAQNLGAMVGSVRDGINASIYSESRLEIGFCRPGKQNTIDLGTDPSINWLLKRSTGTNKYDAQVIAPGGSFTRFTETNPNSLTDYFYAGTIDFSAPAFEKLLGVDVRPQFEQFTVACTADTSSSLHGAYFLIYEAAAATRAIQLTTSGTPTPPTATAVTLVTIAANASANTIGAAIAAALSASTQYTVTNSSGTLTFTALAVGPRGWHNPATSGFVITLTSCGMSPTVTTDEDSVALLSQIEFEYDSAVQISEIFGLTLQNSLLRPSASSPASTSSAARRNTTAISSGTNLVTVTFATAMPSTNYQVDINIVNTTDATPLILFPGTIHSKTTAGFAFRMNGDTDTANYVALTNAYLI
ncbi:MAG: hypothetical protein EBR82_19150 [Caulobacteraceae bacterium]|nr:hypothetical protein [Caulobacteraceae bacterium]